MSSLRIGTAVFGLNYGITNARGRVSASEAKEIIAEAVTVGIKRFDTAHAYGNAERIIGESGYSRLLDITTKVRIESDRIERSTLRLLSSQAIESLENLKVNSVNCLLIHGVDKLGEESKRILSDWLLDKKSEGLALKTGVSIYDIEELNGITEDALDVVQLPMSVYDQRRVNDGTLERLYSDGKIIQARSIFLQGLILQGHKDWPGWICETDKMHHRRFCEFVEDNSLTLQEAAVKFATRREVGEIVAGITSAQELSSLNLAFKKMSQEQCRDMKEWALNSLELLDPRKWPRIS